MSWHHIPKDDAWKHAHLAMLVRLGKRAWLHCDDCRHSVMIEPHALAQQHGLDMLTPLLTISKGDALHALWSAEGMLPAGTSYHAGDRRPPVRVRYPPYHHFLPRKLPPLVRGGLLFVACA